MADAQGWPDPERLGVPANPERDGWHWLQHTADPRVLPVAWSAGSETWWGGGGMQTPLGIVRLRWRYLGPALQPAEVAAAVAQARREALEDAAGVADGERLAWRAQTANDDLEDMQNKASARACELLAAAIRALVREGGDA